MLKPDNRLRAKADFARLFAKGRPVHARGLTLKFAPNRHPESRVGFVVSTKVSKRAVVRNRVRRRLREIVRARMPGVRGGYDMAFIVKPELKDVDFATLVAAVDYLFGKAGLSEGNRRQETGDRAASLRGATGGSDAAIPRKV
jgi:ribonuclease P protein component